MGLPLLEGVNCLINSKKNISIEILPLICTPAATFQHHSACKTPKTDLIYLRNPANKNPTEVISLLYFTQMREELVNQYTVLQTKHKVKQTIHLFSLIFLFFFKLLHFLSHQNSSALIQRPPLRTIFVTVIRVISLTEQ